MNWEDKMVVVTGAGGFIGSHLTESLLEKGAQVTAFVRYNSRHSYGWLEELYRNKTPGFSIMLGDIRDLNIIKKLTDGSDIIFHLAALIGIPYSYMAPDAYIETNVKGSYNVFQSALDAEAEKVIHTSTSEVYGTARYVPINEEHPLQGQSPYAASKIAADQLADSYFRSFGLPIVTVRPFNTFGPRQSARAVIPSIISQALKGNEIKLGSLDPVRDMTFVEDTVKGFIAAAETENINGETVNIGSGKGYSIRELVDTISEIMNQDFEVITDEERVRPSKSEVMQLISCATKAKDLMNWKAETDLREGLARTVDWISDNRELFKSTKYIY
jgi:NAD dependent epimerase/dehydratase